MRGFGSTVRPIAMYDAIIIIKKTMQPERLIYSILAGVKGFVQHSRGTNAPTKKALK